MNRENKRKTYDKHYYRIHPCEDSFTCRSCGWRVTPQGAGSQHRNHCPNCLCSVHLDIEPGDREADCGGLMEPIAVWVRKGGEWAVLHRCRVCGWISSNRLAADDNPVKLMSIALRPLTSPPFPLERLKEQAEDE
ncbi:MAG: RNHCP domain-containing protein [Aristaeellaceae bacterium]